ncbi:putative CDP-diglyceride synthetase [Vibrio nigripulchritudo SFn27]|uniref:Putative CDP-diglyceride synthetase n=1 Tax=Vibrio nigripulchritudo TaxID=28173 RepID=U4KHD4_9VIBR|nr:CDP-archaeol synthase [Vibrio nigripulchritudo]CCN81220.1 putative CDP-diglyceride synthetase [Vibrio nigripulchritudo BLFn1]CCN88186.1 putative CDP-diglyceride synthetase [Vibrio nigripulchritudo SFn27]CCN96110.1 putative CDP-diglyceride synthetase [Vibrio nigripulchritudo ENn2]CCO42344.1 putative CDP-diglyceride synthetase [Vibrio nigripulchritudo SFn135]CCO53590.1 putative CDP-diglyceride synthetase [Vibrio nigripulchritudo Wn13]
MNFLETLNSVLYLLLPIVVAGLLNMVFLKLPLLKAIHIPMDGGRTYRDGKAWFGKNKTWKGFVGMVVFSALSFYFIGAWTAQSDHLLALSVIPYDQFSQLELLLLGASCGLGYVLFELPNSFIKRRCDVPPGGNIRGIKGALFNFFDQSDSVIGCLLFLMLFYRLDATIWIATFITATLVHYMMNIILYALKLKSSPW